MNARLIAATLAAGTMLAVGAVVPADAAISHLVVIKNDAGNGAKRLRVYPDSGYCGGASVVINPGQQTYGRSFKSATWDATAKTSLGVRFGVSAGSCSGPENNYRVTAWRVFLYRPGVPG